VSETGRLKRAVHPLAAEILFGGGHGRSEDDLRAELATIAAVDEAHVVMLVERGVMRADDGRALLGEVRRLRSGGFVDVLERPAPRGAYLAYESFLAERLGSDVAGALPTGRSRNDLNATVLRLRLRRPLERLARETLRLGVAALRRAERHRGAVMPAYTHYQAAVPITYGHYLAGAGFALLRGMSGLVRSAQAIDESPLGAGAVGGTSVPVDTARTAELLGFGGAAPNSVEAVASRDFVLRLLGELAVLGVLLGRLAQDLLLWTTEEFGLLRLPETLVGSSSMMPQKRNAFLLEHVQGKAAAPLGAFTAAAAATAGAPFTNAISVGTEGASHVWRACAECADALVLLRLVVRGATPVPDEMEARALAGFTTATALAERLALEGTLPFRTAHHAVGAAVAEAVERERPLEEVLGEAVPEPAEVVARNTFGGGPGPSSLDGQLLRLRRSWSVEARRFAAFVARWRQADELRERAVSGLLEESPATEAVHA
jgi:argininosuccinate lyase